MMILKNIFEKIAEQAHKPQEREALLRVRNYTQDMGELGQEFNGKLAAARTKEFFYEPENATTEAVFTSFSYNVESNIAHFANEIHYKNIYRKEIFSNTLLGFRFHEGVHALQHQSAPILHVSSVNLLTRLALCPRHSIWQNQLIERDAYAKEALMLALARENKTIPFSDENKGRVLKFQKIFDQKKGNIVESLIKYSDEFRDELKAQINKNKAIPFSHYYAESTHNSYLKNMKLRMEYHTKLSGKKTLGPTIFIRLSPEDVESLGQSFGPNMYQGADTCSIARKPRQFSPELEQKILALNTELGIRKESELPTLDEALADFGLTRKEFLAKSLSNTPIPQLNAYPAPTQ